MRHKKGARLVLILAIFFAVCSITSESYAESQIKMWMSQTVYVPIYSHIYLSQEKKIKLDFSAFISIRNTDPEKAAPGTIRKRFARSLTENAVHASDSAENARKEIAYIFSGESY